MATNIFLLLDMSTSMMDGQESTIDACNEFMDGQMANIVGTDAVVSIRVFNTYIGSEDLVNNVPLSETPRIDQNNYQPSGGTPLYDAIGDSIESIGEYDGQVLFIVQTDGEENSSIRFNRDDVVRIVKEKTSEGWQFVYLGCDIDAMESGFELGISAGNTMSYTRSDTGKAFQDLKMSTARYLSRASIQSKEFFSEIEENSGENGSDRGSDSAKTVA